MINTFENIMEEVDFIFIKILITTLIENGQSISQVHTVYTLVL
jgi:hypothetical protein